MSRSQQRLKWAAGAIDDAQDEATVAWIDAWDAIDKGWTPSRRWSALRATARAIKHLERAQRHMMLVDAGANDDGGHDE